MRRPIVFVHGTFGLGGAEVLRACVARELIRRGVPFSICILGGESELAAHLRDEGVSVEVLGRSHAFYSTRTTWALWRYIRRNNARVVQGSQFDSNFHARIAGWLARTPVRIAEEHGMHAWKSRIHRWIDRGLSRITSRIVAVSDAVAKFNVEVVGIHPSRLVTMRNPCCVSVPEGIPKRQSSTVTIGTVGNLRIEKAHHVLIEAFALLHDSGLPVRLAIVGEGARRPVLERQVRDLGLEQSVQFAGSQMDVTYWLSSYDIFAFPSMSEGLGIAVVEAMAFGIPIVASHTGGIPELISDGVEGFLVEPGSVSALAARLKELVTSKELRVRMGFAGRENAKRNHDPARYVDTLLSLYDELDRTST